MRVLIVGANNEQVASAIGIAVRQGATLRHVATPETAVQELCAGRGADLLLVDVALDIARLIGALATERICVPVFAYGVGTMPAQGSPRSRPAPGNSCRCRRNRP
jgi:two-component system, response regulator FlrC